MFSRKTPLEKAQERVNKLMVELAKIEEGHSGSASETDQKRIRQLNEQLLSAQRKFRHETCIENAKLHLESVAESKSITDYQDIAGGWESKPYTIRRVHRVTVKKRDIQQMADIYKRELTLKETFETARNALEPERLETERTHELVSAAKQRLSDTSAQLLFTEGEETLTEFENKILEIHSLLYQAANWIRYITHQVAEWNYTKAPFSVEDNERFHVIVNKAADQFAFCAERCEEDARVLDTDYADDSHHIGQFFDGCREHLRRCQRLDLTQIVEGDELIQRLQLSETATEHLFRNQTFGEGTAPFNGITITDIIDDDHVMHADRNLQLMRHDLDIAQKRYKQQWQPIKREYDSQLSLLQREKADVEDNLSKTISEFIENS